MSNILLSSNPQIPVADILIWVSALLIVVFLVALYFWQAKKGRELKAELRQLDKVRVHNIESEFILKAMRLSVWHIDPKTKSVTYQSDYREKGNEWVPISDGTKLEESNLLLMEQDVPHVARALDDICLGRTPDYHETYRVKIPHSKKFYWEESFATVAAYGDDGLPSSIVGTSMRIDDRKAMEQALVDARNRAEESGRLKSAFVANMSHEIRTPLNAIIGFTSILPDVDGAEERRQLIDLIQENNQKLLRIVDDVMTISKIEAGNDQLVMTTFDVNAVLQEVYDSYLPKGNPDVQMTTAFSSAQHYVTTDLERVRTIVEHLLSNAVKFTASGSIVVGSSKTDDGGVHIWVRDTGKGIAEENHEKIFDRFFKVDEFVPGAGLGLSTCRIMAYSLGTEIGLESRLGEGSTFWFDLNG